MKFITAHAKDLKLNNNKTSRAFFFQQLHTTAQILLLNEGNHINLDKTGSQRGITTERTIQ